MKKFLKILPMALISFFVVVNLATAADTLTYVPLVDMSPVTGATSVTASGYITNFLTVFMMVIVAMALYKITEGGLKIMISGDNASKRTEAKTDITQAIYGLVLALMTYTILTLINPGLIPGESLFDFKIENK